MVKYVPHRSFRNILIITGFALMGGLYAALYGGGPVAELPDPDVELKILNCGTASGPPGTGMPDYPDQPQKFYTKQHWTKEGDLKVEVWQFLEPGYVLESIDRKVDGAEIKIRPRWVIQDNGVVAACYAKYGVTITFHGLPRKEYEIVPR